MNFVDFTNSLSDSTPPAGLTVQLIALWYDAKNDWKASHDLINDLEDKDSAWVHAYLHRKEGDEGNAGYWYRRAGKEFSLLSLKDEWATIIISLLGK